jgi:hypothetical protein
MMFVLSPLLLKVNGKALNLWIVCGLTRYRDADM